MLCNPDILQIWALKMCLGKSPLILGLLEKEVEVILLQEFLLGSPWDNS